MIAKMNWVCDVPSRCHAPIVSMLASTKPFLWEVLREEGRRRGHTRGRNRQHKHLHRQSPHTQAQANRRAQEAQKDSRGGRRREKERRQQEGHKEGSVTTAHNTPKRTKPEGKVKQAETHTQQGREGGGRSRAFPRKETGTPHNTHTHRGGRGRLTTWRPRPGSPAPWSRAGSCSTCARGHAHTPGTERVKREGRRAKQQRRPGPCAHKHAHAGGLTARPGR